nr:sialate O-acetylesterase [Cytophagales bacterium]
MRVSYIYWMMFWVLSGHVVQETHAQTPTAGLDIFLVIGQSNMAGRAEITTDLTDPIPGVYLFAGLEDSLWVPAKNPLNLYSTIRKDKEMQRLGPTYRFAQVIRKDDPSREIGLVVNAKGGTALAEWMPGTHFYKEALSRVKAAAKQGKIRGVIWHQGESDLGKLETYLPDLLLLIQKLRTDLGMPELPFIAGHIAEDQPERKAFNDLIDQLPDMLPFTAVVHGKATKTFDRVHFDTESQLLMGQRYGEKMLELLDKVKNETIR